MKHMISGLLAAGLALASAGTATAATVTVQVEGQAKHLSPVSVATPASVTKDGTNRCDGDTAIGALDVATNGDWSGSYAYGSYSVETLLGEAHPFGSGAFWTFYVNGEYQNEGACGVHVQNGDEVLFYDGDDPYTAGEGGYDEPVILSAPATAAPGQAFTVTVKNAVTTFDSNTYVGTTHFEPSSGATVTAGAAHATTGADGTAALTLADRGPVELVATNGNRAPDRTTVCVTDGQDGYCGTTKPDGSTVQGSGGGTAPSAPKPPCTTTGDDGFCGSPDKRAAYGSIASVGEQQRFARGKGPRELAGRVADEPSGIADVRLRLTRNDHGHCSTYDGRREAFTTMKTCGATHGTWFSAGADSAWRYLLPGRLGRGRYVLDVMVVDKAGNRDDRLARGRNRVVFFVG